MCPFCGSNYATNIYMGGTGVIMICADCRRRYVIEADASGVLRGVSLKEAKINTLQPKGENNGPATR